MDARQVRRYRDKFGIPFPLLLAGINDTEAAAASLPQLRGLHAFPTTMFLGRDGRVRRVHAGFYGPATGAQHGKLVEDFEGEIERLLEERSSDAGSERNPTLPTSLPRPAVFALRIHPKPEPLALERRGPGPRTGASTSPPHRP